MTILGGEKKETKQNNSEYFIDMLNQKMAEFYFHSEQLR